MPAFTENPLVHILRSNIAWPYVVAVREEEIRGVGRSRSLWKIPQSPHPPVPDLFLPVAPLAPSL